VIEFQGVSRSFGSVKALDDVDLTIEAGEFVVLIGASGSGKSTLLKMINRMESHDQGRILFGGAEINSFKPRELRLRMGYVIQSVGLFPHWSVARNIAVVPQMLGWARPRIEARIEALLELFELDPALYRDRFPHQLSGGQQQRVGVARALAGEPDLLLMDEPFGALDPLIRASLQQEIARVHRSSGTTIVMVTHDIDEALLLATRIVLLDRGRVLQVGTPLQLLAEPANAQVEDFVGRSDVGIRLLSLRPAASLARLEPPCDGPGLPAIATLREAVSHLAARQSACVNLIDAAGGHAGVLHAADIFRSQPQLEIGSAELAHD
jgi:osmoprotectant transport system ATP-binding protein